MENLLQTKLYMPQVHSAGLVSRPRLIERLDEGLRRKLILISAPAGFGKTTLVSEWIEKLKIRDKGLKSSEAHQSPQLAWVSLDESDNDPARFWAYVVAALEMAQSGVGETALALLDSPQFPPLNSILTLLINNLAAVSKDFVLILDDYHVIEAQPIHDSLIFLLDHLPSNVTIIITSRIDPPLPLSRLRVRRQSLELLTENLRFRPDETATLLNHVMGLGLSPDDIAALEARTEGWIAGLQLAAISIQGRPDVDNFIAAFTGSHHYILDYLTEEVLNQQPEHIRSFMQQTAILNRLNGSLCNAVTGRNDGQLMLEKLAQSNLFVVPLDDQRRWYRYHRLFADLLRHRLQQRSSTGEQNEAQLPDLHRRASAWYEQEGFIDEAIHHALVVRDFDQAARQIEQNIETMSRGGELAVLRRWLESFPEEQISKRPQLSLIYAWLLSSAGELAAAERWLRDAEQTWELGETGIIEANKNERPTGTQPVEIPAVTALYAQIALMRGDIPRVIELSQRALDHLPESSTPLRGTIGLNLGTAYWLNGDVEAADRIMAELNAISRTTGDSLTTMLTNNNLAEMQTFQGRLHQAALLYRRVLQLAAQEEKQPVPLTTSRAHIGLGGILYEWNDLEAAAHHLKAGIDQGKQGSDIRSLISGYVGLARVFQAQENSDEALQMMEETEKLVQSLGPGLIPTLIRAFQVHVWLTQGNLEAATQWVRECNLSTDDEFDSVREYEYSVLARVMMAQGNMDSAVELLARLYQTAQAARRTRSVIEILILQALAYQTQKATDRALTAIEQALTLAEPEGYIRIFADEGPPMAALLLKYIDRQEKENSKALPAPHYVQKLLAPLDISAIVASESKTNRSTQALIDPLTERELEILYLVAAGLSNRAIADQLVVAVSTVKTHTKNIYGKLGINSRIQAVAKAKELDLL